MTDTVKLHIVFGLNGLASDAMQLTVVVPGGNVEPLAGVQLMLAPGQLSDAVAV